MEKEKRKNRPSPKKIQIVAMIITVLVLTAPTWLALAYALVFTLLCARGIIEMMGVAIIVSSPIIGFIFALNLSYRIRERFIRHPYVKVTLGTLTGTTLLMSVIALIGVFVTFISPTTHCG